MQAIEDSVREQMIRVQLNYAQLLQTERDTLADLRTFIN